MGNAGDHVCGQHKDMTPKKDMYYLVGKVISLTTVLLGGVMFYVLYACATQNDIKASEEKVTAKVVAVEKLLDRDREEASDNQKAIEKELRNLNIYIRSLKK